MLEEKIVPVLVFFLKSCQSWHRSRFNALPSNVACRRFEALGYDLRAWRANELRKGVAKDDLEGFEVMDLERGAGWDLVTSLLAFQPQDRLTATQCLEHRWFSGAAASSDAVSNQGAFPGLKLAGQALGKVLRAQGDALGEIVTRDGSLSEAQLMEVRGSRRVGGVCGEE